MSKLNRLLKSWTFNVSSKIRTTGEPVVLDPTYPIINPTNVTFGGKRVQVSTIQDLTRYAQQALNKACCKEDLKVSHNITDDTFVVEHFKLVDVTQLKPTVTSTTNTNTQDKGDTNNA